MRNEFILNEKEYIEKMIQEYDLGKRPSHTLLLAARYWRESGYDKQEIRSRLEDFIIRSDPNSSIVKWSDSIDWSLKYMGRRNLICIDSVPITKLEIDVCKTVGSIQKQRVMFTLFCLAKFEHIANPKNDGWVSTPDSKLFSLANVVTNVRRQSLMLNELMQNGYIQFAKNIDNISMKVLYMDLTSPPFIEITDYRNLGNQYMYHTDSKYIKCERCGLIIRRSSNNHKFCKSCAREVNIEKTSSSSKIKRRLVLEEGNNAMVTAVM